MDPLNNDCIDYIMDFLDLRSKVNLALASKECCEYFTRWARRRLKVVNKDSQLSENEMKSLLRFAGQYIENIELYADFLPEIVKFCTNLKHLSISLDYKRSFETQIPTLAMIQSLESIHYNIEGKWNETLENVIKTIAELPKLKTLILNSEGYGGKYLNELKHIETLELNKFSYLLYEHFNDFCASTKTLRTVYFGEGLIDENIVDALELCESLENLVLLHTFVKSLYNYVHIPNLKRLYVSKRFDLMGSWDPMLRTFSKDKQLEALCLYPFNIDTQVAVSIGSKTDLKQLLCCISEPELLHHLTNLKDLEYFECHCMFLTDNHLLKIIATHPKLLYFGTESNLLTTKFVHKLVKFLKNDDSKKRSGKLYIGVHQMVLEEIKKTICIEEFIDYFNIIDINLERKRDYFMNVFHEKLSSKMYCKNELFSEEWVY